MGCKHNRVVKKSGKNLFLLAGIFLFLAETTNAQSYHANTEKSSVKFYIKNSGMEIEGEIGGIEGDILFQPGDLKNASFSVTANPATINTGIDIRDKNLQEEAYFNTRQYPQISIQSKQVLAQGNGRYLMKATLIIKGIHKDIQIPFSATVQDDGLLFTGECRINRLDYKIGTGSVVLSDTILIRLSVFAQKG